MLLTLKNIWRLGIKELWSLWRDPVMLILIVYTFTASVYTAASAMPETLHHAPIAIVDEDQLAAVAAHRLGLLPAAVHAAADARLAGGGPGHGRGRLHLCPDHSARLPARRAGRQKRRRCS